MPSPPDPLSDINLIVTVPYGRAGSLLIQSLFDNHPNVVTLPYFGAMYSLIPPSISNLDRQIDWFVETFPAIFDTSRGYFGDVGASVSGKFGPRGDEDLVVNSAAFKEKLRVIAREHRRGRTQSQLSRKDFFIYAHLAYAACVRSLDIGAIKYIFFNPHTHDEWHTLLNDFPALYFIAMTRDPRQDWASWRKIHAARMGRDISRIPPICLFLSEYKYSGSSFALSSLIERLESDHIRVIDLEELHVANKKAILHLCSWLKLEFDECLLQSTFNGRQWAGNAANLKKISAFNPEIKRDAWRTELPAVDRDLINCLLPGSIAYLGYKVENAVTEIGTEKVRDALRYKNSLLLFWHCFLYQAGNPLTTLSRYGRNYSLIAGLKRATRKTLSLLVDFLSSAKLSYQLRGDRLDSKLREISIQQQELLRKKLPPHLFINYHVSSASREFPAATGHGLGGLSKVTSV